MPRFVDACRPATAGGAPVPAGRGADRRPPRASSSPACRWSSTTCSGSPATPSSRSTRTATRTCCRRWSGSWPGAGSARRCGWRSPRPSPTTCSTCWSASSTWTTTTCCGCPGCSTCPRCGRSTSEVDRARPQGPPVRAGHPPALRRGRDAAQRLLPPARRRHPGAPPVPLVLHQRAALHRAGRRRPARAGHQADALPHQRRLPDRRRADRRGRGRQAGGGAGRGEGPLRRAGQHRLGAHAGAGRLPRRLRPGRASRRTARPRWSYARRAARSGATATSAPATTTPRPPACTRTSACSPPTRRSAPT